MSLTHEDLQQIRVVMREEIDRVFIPLEGEVKALREDVKEIYKMLEEFE